MPPKRGGRKAATVCLYPGCKNKVAVPAKAAATGGKAAKGQVVQAVEVKTSDFQQRFCPGHACTIEECRNSTDEGMKCCTTHRCGAAFCSNAVKNPVEGGFIFCKEHSCQADPKCTNGTTDNTRYCTMHICQKTGCREPVFVGEEGPHRDENGFLQRGWCIIHGCLVNGCNHEAVCDRGPCGDHLCPKLNCLQAGGDQSCGVHGCHSEGCNGIVDDGEIFCDDHRCRAKGCDSRKDSDDRFCEYHKCDVLGCRHQMSACTRTCLSHMCSHNSPGKTNVPCGLPAHRRPLSQCVVIQGAQMQQSVKKAQEARCMLHACRFPGCDSAPEGKTNFCHIHRPQHRNLQTEWGEDDGEESFRRTNEAQTDDIRIEVLDLPAVSRIKPRIGGGFVLPIATPSRILQATYHIKCKGVDFYTKKNVDYNTGMHDVKEWHAGDFLKVSDEPPEGPAIGGTEFGFGDPSGRTLPNRYVYSAFATNDVDGVESVMAPLSPTKPSTNHAVKAFRVLRPGATSVDKAKKIKENDMTRTKGH